MNSLEALYLEDLVIEHQSSPIGIDCVEPRFGWKLKSRLKNTVQTAYRIEIYTGGRLKADTGKIEGSQSIEVAAEGFKAAAMTLYEIKVTVWDNKGRQSSIEGCFETGRLGKPFCGGWVEPEQEPTPDSMIGKQVDRESVTENPYAGKQRDFAEFRPAQYIRIPFTADRSIKKARVYVTAHGLYRLEVNGVRADNREFAPENTSYHKMLEYQTYDVTHLIKNGKNVFGVILADGWWCGRVGTTGDSCQYGDKLGLLLNGVIEYFDGRILTVTGEDGVSSTGPIIFADLFVGEKYDARKEMEGWSRPEFSDSAWLPVKKAVYPMDNLTGQYDPPVRVLNCFSPKEIIITPSGETVLDTGQVLAGVLEFTLDAEEGTVITLEHSEILDEKGNFYNNILGVNKEQTDIYITKQGAQTYRPQFTYHGFRYVKISGWPGRISTNNFKVYTFSSEMEDIGYFRTSDERVNQLQQNIWWSQVSNTIAIPTDCPQREKAGWTGDVMAFAPTMCFNRNADAFLTKWMENVRKDQLDDGAVPMVVPYLKAYASFVKGLTGSDTSCGWGDVVLRAPYAVYRAYGDRKILEDNYTVMSRWLQFIRSRAENHHPQGWSDWEDGRKERSRYLWNTDFHFGDWLIPSLVLGNPDGGAMLDTAYVTMGSVGPAYYAYSALSMAEIAEILGKEEDAGFYRELYGKIREAFILEYVHEDGTLDADFQGIYVIALKNGLVTEEARPRMVEHLCGLIEKNGGCLDTGFLSIPFLLDVLCENGRRDMAYKLLFQTKCPSWLYEVEKGATTMWESWGAISEDGTVSTYSYNHYAFGCVGDWMYREIGGLKVLEPGYKRMHISPALDCGLTYAEVKENTPYGEAAVRWEKDGGIAMVHIVVPPNTTALVELPGMENAEVGSGEYTYCVKGVKL